MRNRRPIVAGMLIGLTFGALLGALAAPILAFAALVLSAFGAMPEPWPVVSGSSWLAWCGLAALWGVQLGGVLGMLYGLFDTAWMRRRHWPAHAH
jgi:hypothetical protein